jgi:hypothetical protein
MKEGERKAECVLVLVLASRTRGQKKKNSYGSHQGSSTERDDHRFSDGIVVDRKRQRCATTETAHHCVYYMHVALHDTEVAHSRVNLCDDDLSDAEMFEPNEGFS